MLGTRIGLAVNKTTQWHQWAKCFKTDWNAVHFHDILQIRPKSEIWTKFWLEWDFSGK